MPGTLAVRPGFRGSLTLNLGAAGATALGIKQGSVRETIDKIITNSTASTLDSSNLLPETRTQSVKRLALNVQAQVAAGGAGDPPNFAGTNTYGDIPVVATFGDVITGNFQIDEIGNSIDVNGSIDYDLAMGSNGAYTRTRASFG